MSLQTSIEILIYFKDFKNIDLFQQGIYQLRISISNSIPYMKLDQLGIKGKKIEHHLMSAEIINNYFYSRQLWVRFEDETHQISDGCIFRLEIPSLEKFNDQNLLFELFFIDSKTFRDQIDTNLIKVCEQQFTLKNIQNFNINYFALDFNPNFSCLVNCILLSCPLNIKYHLTQNGQTIDALLQYVNKNNTNNIFASLTIDRLKFVLQSLSKAYKDCISEFIQDPNNFANYLSVLTNLPPINEQNYAFETILNNISSLLYTLWYKYLEIVVKVSTKIIIKYKIIYMQQMVKSFHDFVIQITNNQINNISPQLIQSLRSIDQRSLYQPNIAESPQFSQIPILLQEGQFKNQTKLTNHLIVYVHGYKGSPYDMRRWRNVIKQYYPDSITLFSEVNQREADQSIFQMGRKLATEIQRYVIELGKVDNISLICHSIGGIVARAALTFLQQLKDKLYFMLTLGSPHLGIIMQQSNLVKTGFWMMTNIFQNSSMVELALQDTRDLENSSMYQLSQSPCLSWFKKLILVSSKQDEYVPWESARIQNSPRILLEKKEIISKMVNNIQLPETTRYEVIFSKEGNNWDNLIGRMAHMSLVENVLLIKMIVLCGNFLN